MQFRVVQAVASDTTTPPQFLVLPTVAPIPTHQRTRALALVEEMSMYWDGPAAAMLGTLDSEGNAEHKRWADPVSEKPDVGDTEIWELYNTNPDAHTMHIHQSSSGA
jgi:spore coat protein A, manganese oxidase